MSKNPSRVVVRAGYLLATEPFISAEETRYFLNGIYIEPHQALGAVLVATDGHTLSAIHDAEAIVQGNPQIWRLSWKRTLKGPMDAYIKAARGIFMPPGHIYADLVHELGEPNVVRLVHADTAADVFNGRGVEVFKKVSTPADKADWGAIDGTFPEWRRVCPTDNTAERFCPGWYQTRYIAKIAAFGQALQVEANDDLRPEAYAPMTIFGGAEPSFPAVARFARPEGFVVIMPIREVGDALVPSLGGLPGWYHAIPPAEVEFPEERDLKIVA